MTQIITRYFADAADARKAKKEMVNFNRFPPRIIDIYDNSEGLVAQLTSKRVDAATAEA